MLFVKQKLPQLNMLRGKADEVTSEVYINHFLYAPVAEDTEVGKIKYYYKNELIHEEPIFTSQSVGYKKFEKPVAFSANAVQNWVSCFK